MDISAGLIAKGTLAASAVAGGSYLSYNNWDKIVDFTNTKILGANDNREINKKLKELGIDGCDLANGESSKECTLNKEKLDKVIFSNKSETGFSITGLDTDKNINLKVEKNHEAADFPEGLKFILKNTNDADVSIGTTNEKVTLKKDIPREFKLSIDKTKLEKAWTLGALGGKVRLTCPSTASASGTTKECTFIEKVNVWKEDGDYIVDGKLPTPGTSQKITYAEDAAGYFEGLKFTVANDICLTEGTKAKDSNGIEKLTHSNKSYEIGVKEIGGEKKWFLIEK